MTITTSKPQTTRHRIHAILNEDDYQIVFSDTPGIIEDPRYKMHKSMNQAATSSFEDADIMLFMTDQYDKYEDDDPIVQRLTKASCVKFLVINKMDIAEQETLKKLCAAWEARINFDQVFIISAKEDFGVAGLLEQIKANLKEGPAYYPKDQISDRSMRFFCSEMIREKILMIYKKEIPYAVEVVVDKYLEREKHGRPLVEIGAVIFVGRKTHKSIIIGREGAAIKKLGIAARREIEKFIKAQVHLELYVKLKEDWRNDDKMLKHFGY